MLLAGALGVLSLAAIAALGSGAGTFSGPMLLQDDFRVSATGLAVSSDGQLLAVGYSAGEIALHDLGSGKRLRVLDAGSRDFNHVALAFNADGSVLASGNWDTRLRFWNPKTGEAARPERKLPFRITAVAWGRGKRVAVSCSGLNIYDTTSDELSEVSGGVVRSLGFSRSGRLLASIAERGHGRVWDPGTLEQTALLEGDDHNRQTVALAVRPDGGQIATATGPEIYLWTPDGELERALPGHPSAKALNALAYGPRGKVLASAGDLSNRPRGAIKLWNPLTGAAVGERQAKDKQGDPSTVYALAFTPDGRLIAGHGSGFTVWKGVGE
jgi:WD40 repeat protein